MEFTQFWLPFCLPPFIRGGRRPIEKILGLNQWMKEYAATEGIGYLDYYSAMVNDQHGLKPEFSGDGVHPNEAGYTIMASIVADAITRSKLQPSKKSP
jgi:lysophospholipase L1-like esterase